MTDPNGCRHCGIAERDHADAELGDALMHTYVQPSDPQRLQRMYYRRAARGIVCRWCREAGHMDRECAPLPCMPRLGVGIVWSHLLAEIDEDRSLGSRLTIQDAEPADGTIVSDNQDRHWRRDGKSWFLEGSEKVWKSWFTLTADHAPLRFVQVVKEAV
jgi:hypothetical protein